MNRKPIFDAVRKIIGRGFTQAEVDELDLACDFAEAAAQAGGVAKPAPSGPTQAHVAKAKLGGLSEEFESSGRGPGTVSGGVNDPGGVSYGVYQFASKTGTCAAFVRNEGKAWSADFGSKKPGGAEFSAAWKAVADRHPDGFREAQHAFIERTHYRPVVATVSDRKGLNLDDRSNAVRDATWSCAVQHSGAPDILIDAIDQVDRDTQRDSAGYDRKLIEAIYDVRIAYVLRVAQNPKLSAGERNQLISITKNRYPKERTNALKMLGGAQMAPAAAPVLASNGLIDGNLVAAANGVDVKSASVKISKLHPKMEAVIVAVAGTAKALGLPKPVITSGNDSNHKSDSLHYKNQALDFRGNNIKVTVGQTWRNEVSTRLGAGYDVLFETFINPANNHLHVEYDPN